MFRPRPLAAMHDRPSSSTSEKGQWAEDAAVSLLETAGVEILARNVIAGGVELDVIAREGGTQGDTYVFVEVRSRAHAGRGDPLETIDARKRGRLVRGATAWRVEQGLWERVYVRFDVIAALGMLAGPPDAQGEGSPRAHGPGDPAAAPAAPELRWLKGAFEA